MNKFKILVILILFFKLNIISGRINRHIRNWNKSEIDVTLIGVLNYPDGIGRIGFGFIDIFKNKLKTNIIPSITSSDFESLSHIDNNTLESIKNAKNVPGNVSLLFYPLDRVWTKLVPYSLIKVAYSVWESDRIPEEWVTILNNEFDAVITACPFLVNAYKNSGVNIPIFLMPHAIYIDEFLNEPIKEKANKPFTFGCSATFLDKKNVYKLVIAFSNKFGNNKNFKLRLHSRSTFGFNEERSRILEFLSRNNISNVEVIEKILSQDEYLDFMRSLDCYVLISKGEGFSVTPREAIALGIPTIISNNTAHEVLCQTPYFIPIKSDIKVPADYRWHFGRYIGSQYDCDIKDVEVALEYVYNNYDLCLEKAKGGKEWVKQYTYPSLEKKYLNLVKPQNIILGDDNIITDNYLMTNSKKLYDKYLLLKN